MQMPKDFKYKDAADRGRPGHEKTDPFRIRHPSMPLSRRAKIFAPFDALTGFYDAVRSKEVLYTEKRCLSETEKEALMHQLSALQQLTANSRLVRKNAVVIEAEYYQPCTDPEHEYYGKGGTYETITGICRGIDPEGFIRIDEHSIHFSNVVRLYSPTHLLQ